MREVAEKYYGVGLSVIALQKDKRPMGHWKERQNELLPPKEEKYDTCYGIGIICGKVSGNLECIDIDCKYDLTGELMENFRLVVEERCDVLEKVVIEKTPSGGWHIIYRCAVIQNNQKLSKRYASQEELKAEPNDKVRTLFETRGEGGYFMCAPTPGYEVTTGDMLAIPMITEEERSMLFECAKAFNEVYEPENRPSIRYGEINIFDEYNDTADVSSLLQEYQWTYKGRCDGNLMFKRPGDSESAWSGGYHPDKKIFHVFSTSTAFDTNKGYSPSGVLCMLKFNGDWRECAKWLNDRKAHTNEPKKKITEGKDNGDYFSTVTTEMGYLTQVRTGTLEMGKSTGFNGLDEYWRHKEKYLVVINGVDNVGKSQVMWYLYVLAAKMYGWRYLIYAGENRTGSVYRKLMEFYLCKPMSSMTDAEFKVAKEFIDFHFTVIKNKAVYTYRDMLDIGDKALGNGAYKFFMWDPYNSFTRDRTKGLNPHDYDYEALGDARQWITSTGCGIHIVCHSVTEALRKLYPRDHPRYANLVMPPGKADTEGGGKFGNRTDDFLTIHRHTQSEDDWMWTEIYNRKNKENETGGRQTPYDKPFRMRMINGSTGFESEEGYNPITKETNYEAKPLAVKDYTEPLKVNHEVEQADLPF